MEETYKEILNKRIIDACKIGYVPEETKGRIMRIITRRYDRKAQKVFQEFTQFRIDVIRSLIDAGADINAQEGQALVNACKYKLVEQLVLFLIKNGADVNAQNGKCMENAAEAEAWDTMELLLDNGATKAGNSISILLEKITGKHYDIGKIIYFVARIQECCKENEET